MPKYIVVLIILAVVVVSGCGGVSKRNEFVGHAVHGVHGASTAFGFYLGKVQVGDTIAVYPYFREGSAAIPFLYMVASLPDQKDPGLSIWVINKEGSRQIMTLAALRGYVLSGMGVGFFPQRN